MRAGQILFDLAALADAGRWKGLAERLSPGAKARVVFPSHVPARFEAVTGAWGRFEQVVGDIRELLDRGVEVVLEHSVEVATHRDLPDLPRFVDDRLEEVVGVELVAGEPMAANRLRPWLRGALHVFELREVGVRLGADSGLPCEAVERWREPPWRGLHPGPERRGKGSEVSIATTRYGISEGVDKALAQLRGLGRWSYCMPPCTPREVYWQLTAPGSDKVSLSTDQARYLVESMGSLRPGALVFTGEDVGSRRDLAVIVKTATDTGLRTVLTGGGEPPSTALLGELRALGLAAVRPGADATETWAARAREVGLPLDVGGPSSTSLEQMPSCADFVAQGYVELLEGGCPGGGGDNPAMEGKGWAFVGADGGLSVCALRDLAPAPTAGRSVNAHKPWNEGCQRAQEGRSESQEGCPHAAPPAPERILFGVQSDGVPPRVEVVEALVKSGMALGGGVTVAVEGDPACAYAKAVAEVALAAGAQVDPTAEPCPELGAFVAVGDRVDERAHVSVRDLADMELVLVGDNGAALEAVAAGARGLAADEGALGGDPIHLLGLAPSLLRRPRALAPGEAKILVDEARCDSHGACVLVCPTGAITLGEGAAPTVDQSACVRCYACVEQCPTGALIPGGTADTVWGPAPLASHGLGWLSGLGTVGERPPEWQRPRPTSSAARLVLGVAFTTQQHHGAALLRDGEIVAAVQEERFRRKKQYGWFPPGRQGATVVSDHDLPLDLPMPWRSVAYCLREAGVTLDDVDVIAVNGIPERFMGTYSLHDPAKPPRTVRSGRWVFVPHHLAHAASAYYVSGLPDACTFTVDGRGERETAAFFDPVDGGLERRWDLLAQHDTSIGGVYETATLILGFGHFGAGSTMGLAAMGQPTMDVSKLLSARSHVDTDIHWRGVQRAYGHLQRHRSGPLYDEHIGLAASVQGALESTVLRLIEEGLDGRKPRALCLAGGVALNCTMNERIRRHFDLEEIFVQPAAHDAGTALGAALEAYRHVTGVAPNTVMKHAYWGPGYGSDAIEATLRELGVPYERLGDELPEHVGDLVADGRIVCWFQGRSEFGPRALGARSILADPRRPETKARLNTLKGRQWWRPFGPSMLAGTEGDFFDRPFESPFMLFTLPVLPNRLQDIPAVLHTNGTTRPQSVTREANPWYYRAIEAFAARSDIPMVVNTSFNTGWEPIVESPADAVASFLQLGADYLAIGDFLVERAVVERLS